jgi:hypothetical protein
MSLLQMFTGLARRQTGATEGSVVLVSMCGREESLASAYSDQTLLRGYRARVASARRSLFQVEPCY